jgi:hypothetical protein
MFLLARGTWASAEPPFSGLNEAESTEVGRGGNDLLTLVLGCSKLAGESMLLSGPRPVYVPQEAEGLVCISAPRLVE